MTDIRAALGAQRLAGELRRHRHAFTLHPTPAMLEDGDDRWRCACGCLQDIEKSRRGRSARRLGGDQERRVERTYGPRKVGEYGDPVDHLGRDWAWQSKSTRAAPPLWLAAITTEHGRERIPAAWERAIEAMTPHLAHRRPLLIRAYVHVGRRTRDWIVVRGSDWAAMHDLVIDSRWLVLTGDEFLCINGRDE